MQPQKDYQFDTMVSKKKKQEKNKCAPTHHRQDSVVAEVRGYVKGELSEAVGGERARRQGELLRLVHQGPHDLGVAVSLIGGTGHGYRVGGGGGFRGSGIASCDFRS